MSCDRTAQIQAYHDGELPRELHASVEQHLNECADCAAVLRDLRQLTLFIQKAPRPEMSADARRRIEQAWWRRRDRGVLRLAEWLTAAAAAVMVATTIWSTAPSERPIEQPNVAIAWQADALIPPTVGRDEPASDVVAVAEWMANDLSPESR